MLKQTNEDLSRDLEHTSQELQEAQQQLDLLQEQASRLHDDREMYASEPLHGTTTNQGFYSSTQYIQQLKKQLVKYCKTSVKNRRCLFDV